MEHSFLDHFQGWVDDSRKNEVSECVQPMLPAIDDPKWHQSYEKGNPQIAEFDIKGGNIVKEKVAPANMETPGEVDMEASISAE